MTPELLLKQAFGPKAKFREGQLEAIQAATMDASRTLVIQRTGWGKSIVYFIATALLRHKGSGPTFLISPLLALMRNQIELAAKFNLRACTINSTNVEDWREIEEQLARDEVDLLLISPERLSNEGFRQRVLESLESRIGLLVVDEAHCISDWGHDFRPDYRRIVQTVQRLKPEAPILCTTATANDRVVDDVRVQLGETLTILRGPLLRRSLRIRVLRLKDQAERLAMLSKLLGRLPGTGIVYTLTVNDARRVAEWLQTQGIDAQPYHSALGHERRLELEEAFNTNSLKCLVATTALGMGYDKPDVAFVIHFQRPGSIISYYQQIGRAGRELPRADVILMEGAEDDDINQYFIDNAFPPQDCFEQMLQMLVDEPKTKNHFIAEINVRDGHVDKALSLLEIHGAIRFEDGKYALTDPDWRYELLQVEQIGRQRLREIQQMRLFVTSGACRMRFLANALDDRNMELCGLCDRCSPVDPPSIDRAQVLEAIEFLRGDLQPLKLRPLYPQGVLAEGRKKIAESQAFLHGVTLSVYNDAGWGTLVRQGKYADAGFSDELIAPSVAAIRTLETQPDWLCWIPSHTRPQLVADFARKLALALRIPSTEAVSKTQTNEPQKTMQNSVKQYANVYDSFEVQEPLSGVCLLVDDVVDSAWTLTAVAIKLARAGCSGIIPFALATAKPRD